MMTVMIELYDDHNLCCQAEKGPEMKVSREQAAQNREHVVDIAATLFKTHGFDGIGVADLMKQAGMTHGGFYGQFASKDELIAEACMHAFGISHRRWQRDVDSTPDPLAAITARYLSARHRDHPDYGCVLTALAADAARRPRSLRKVFSGGLLPFIEMLGRLLPGRNKAARRDKALAAMASMVGAVVLARAVDDNALSDDILRATAAAISGSRSP